jgi:lysozyme
MTMRVSDKGLLEIAEHEGIVPAPYRDSLGVWTFGVGHTAAAGGLDPQEMNGAMPTGAALEKAIDRAIEIFREDVRKYEDRVNDAIKVPLQQHEFDALVSFDFNTGGIYRAKLTQAINAGDHNAARHFMGWLRPPEIRKRRTAEMRLFQYGDYDANGDQIPIWKTNGKGKLVGILYTISGAELLLRMKGPVRPDVPRDRVPVGYSTPTRHPLDTPRWLAALVAFFKGGKA